MDFSQQYFANPQSYPFMGMPPLTPHTTSAASDDFNTTSPPDVYGEYPGQPDQQQQHRQQQQQQQQQFGGFDSYAAPQHFNANPQHHGVFPGPPTPPQNHNLSHQQPGHADVPLANHRDPLVHPPSDNGVVQKREPADDALSLSEQQQANARRGGSNSEDEDLTPAQSRRKAQNRAAQRAFRERKEKHVKELETKLAELENQAKTQSTEHEQLKRAMQKMSTENEILRATSAMNGGGHAAAGAAGSLSPEPRTTGPMEYNPTDFYSDLLAKHNNKTPSHRVVTSSEGERLLAAGATWDYIINHEAFKRGLVDVASVSEHLKNQARCDGQGPVFSEAAINAAIEASVASGSDELL